ncbi:hypothetical protein [Pseudomonas massiliensis]|uniref:hypothetical protein n=1 Tax=Pseudomonas massiliensis TaxID=522492 RepID=UPI00058AE4F7|nr:hypothetical protein [Pseudomonas massiliensis]
MEQSLNLPLETVYIQRIDGTRLGPFEARLEPSKALIWEVTLNAGAGDTLEHHRPGGGVVRHLLTNTHFQPRMTGVEAHYTLRWRSE